MVRLHFTAIDIEYEADCYYDRLSVYGSDREDDNEVMGHICGTNEGLVRPSYIKGMIFILLVRFLYRKF